MSDVEPHQFVVFAAFLSLGYFLGDNSRAVEQTIHRDLVWITVAGAIVLTGYLFWQKRSRAKQKYSRIPDCLGPQSTKSDQ